MQSRTPSLKKKKNLRQYDLDPRIFPPDPRSLDAVSQIIYVIRCLERGLSERDIVALYMDDASQATVIIDLVMQTDLVKRDVRTGKWKRTEKTTRLIAGKDRGMRI